MENLIERGGLSSKVVGIDVVELVVICFVVVLIMVVVGFFLFYLCIIFS